jgi:hypothetical protein
MGMGREMLEEANIDKWVEEDLQKSRTTWTTRDGRVLKIQDMDLDHINNTIAYLNKNDKVVPDMMYKVKFIKEVIN